jgi:large-conductance mechanosensitive channel
MKEQTKSILKYIIEFLIVAFGVFLGIYVSEWRS